MIDNYDRLEVFRSRYTFLSQTCLFFFSSLFPNTRFKHSKCVSLQGAIKSFVILLILNSVASLEIFLSVVNSKSCQSFFSLFKNLQQVGRIYFLVATADNFLPFHSRSFLCQIFQIRVTGWYLRISLWDLGLTSECEISTSVTRKKI